MCAAARDSIYSDMGQDAVGRETKCSLGLSTSLK